MPDISTIRGDSRVIAIPVFDADRDMFRNESDLDTLTEAEYLVSDSPAAETIYLDFTLADANVTIENVSDIDTIELSGLESENADAGIIRIKLENTDTELLPVETLWHELQITDDNGNVSTVMQGDFDVLESATNPN